MMSCLRPKLIARMAVSGFRMSILRRGDVPSEKEAPMKQAEPSLSENNDLSTWVKDVANALHSVPGHDDAQTIVHDIAQMLLVKKHRDTVKPDGQLYRFLQAFNLAGMLPDDTFGALMSRLRDISLRLYASPASDVFEALKQGIDKAVSDENFMSVCNLADELRMDGGEEGRSTSLSYRYQYQDGDGQQVGLHVRSYDPSGPYQNIPDMNRITVNLYDSKGNVMASYDRSYSD